MIDELPELAPKPPRKRRRKPRQRKAQAQGKAIGSNGHQGSGVPDKRPSLPPVDALATMREAQDLAKEGAHKLAQAVDILRAGLELIAQAEFDHQTGRMVEAPELRSLARQALDQYSQFTGQDWRRHKLQGSWAGGTGNKPVHERDMR